MHPSRKPLHTYSRNYNGSAWAHRGDGGACGRSRDLDSRKRDRVPTGGGVPLVDDNAQGTQARCSDLPHTWKSPRHNCVDHGTHADASHRAEAHGNAALLLDDGADEEATNRLQQDRHYRYHLPSAPHLEGILSAAAENDEGHPPQRKLEVEERAGTHTAGQRRLRQGSGCARADGGAQRKGRADSRGGSRGWPLLRRIHLLRATVLTAFGRHFRCFGTLWAFTLTGSHGAVARRIATATHQQAD
mmetsp:Transcript_59327/g.158880  ORF Transcript_59327/g.158880 Transcript_59327/m.158880 type:complete len:245 (+) Transcript_59327:28-762(+)